ncbi:MAG: hypothetical protein QOG87_1994 [Actinomycetota bacterium]
MPDLSEMLGDVYGEPEEPTAPAPATGPTTPGWADDEHLDRAFAEWTPGPDADAPAAERGMFASSQAAPSTHLAHDLAAALSEAVLAETSTEEAVAATTVTEAPTNERVATSAFAQLDRQPELHAEPEPEPELMPEPEAELEPEPAPIPVPVHKAGWQRSDDDILPTGKTAKGGVRLPKARAGKAPKVQKGGDTAPKKARRSLKDLAKMEIGGKKKK